MYLRRVTPNAFDKHLIALEFTSDQFKPASILQDSETQAYVDVVPSAFHALVRVSVVNPILRCARNGMMFSE